MAENDVRYNEPIRTTAKDGSSIMTCKDENPGLLETLYLTSGPDMKEKLAEGLNTPLSETISEEDVVW